MNRKIAFRAWDKENKVMYEVKKVDFSEQKVFCKQYYLNDWKFSEIELMQYTGLKDKNGKEIFEGDIICNNNANWEVGFDEGGYWMRQQEGQHKFIFINEAQHSEVIGNLYENPKLLDNK